MPDNPHVEQLLEELLDSGGTPEEACRTCPELLPQVRAGWQRLRAIAGACPRGDKVRRVCCGLEVLVSGLGFSVDENRRRVPVSFLANLGNTGLDDLILAALAASPQLARLINPNPESGKPMKAKSSRKSLHRG
jgi:hypothetical protein